MEIGITYRLRVLAIKVLDGIVFLHHHIALALGKSTSKSQT